MINGVFAETRSNLSMPWKFAHLVRYPRLSAYELRCDLVTINNPVEEFHGISRPEKQVFGTIFVLNATLYPHDRVVTSIPWQIRSKRLPLRRCGV